MGLRPEPSAHTTRVGRWAEGKAGRLLRRAGYRILDRNVRLGAWELDLVCLRDGVLCFVEVRYRRRLDYGHPIETISPTKQTFLLRAAEAYLAAHPEHAGRPVRFDVVALWGDDAEHFALYEDVLSS